MKVFPWFAAGKDCCVRKNTPTLLLCSAEGGRFFVCGPGSLPKGTAVRKGVIAAGQYREITGEKLA